MMLRYLTRLALVAALSLVVTPPAHAGLVLDFEQAGNDVSLTGRGSIDLTGSSFTIRYASAPGARGIPAYALVGDDPDVYGYSGLVGPGTLGPGSTTVLASSFTGDSFGFFRTSLGNGFGDLYVPVGYVSKTALSGTATFNNATIASLGLTQGTYVYTMPSNDTITVQIGIAAVPEPGTIAGAGVGVALAIGAALKRRRKSTAA